MTPRDNRSASQHSSCIKTFTTCPGIISLNTRRERCLALECKKVHRLLSAMRAGQARSRTPEARSSITLSLERQAMKVNFPVLSGLIFAGLVGALAACSNDATDPSSSSSSSTKATVSVSDNISTLSATLRVRCERRSSRSKISVDGNDLTPRNGRFRARVRAAGGTVTTTAKRAVGARSSSTSIATETTLRRGRPVSRRPSSELVPALMSSVKFSTRRESWWRVGAWSAACGKAVDPKQSEGSLRVNLRDPSLRSG